MMLCTSLQDPNREVQTSHWSLLVSLCPTSMDDTILAGCAMFLLLIRIQYPCKQPATLSASCFLVAAQSRPYSRGCMQNSSEWRGCPAPSDSRCNAAAICAYVVLNVARSSGVHWPSSLMYIPSCSTHSIALMLWWCTVFGRMKKSARHASFVASALVMQLCLCSPVLCINLCSVVLSTNMLTQGRGYELRGSNQRLRPMPRTV